MTGGYQDVEMASPILAGLSDHVCHQYANLTSRWKPLQVQHLVIFSLLSDLYAIGNVAYLAMIFFSEASGIGTIASNVEVPCAE